MRCKLLLLLFFIALGSFATHNRAGYVSYYCKKDKSGNYTNTYHFTIYTYTNPTSVGADRCYETLCFINLGTGLPDTVNCPRTNYTPTGTLGPLQSQSLANCGAECCISPTNPGDGLMLVYPYTTSSGSCPSYTYGGVKVNTYEHDYTFSSNSAQYIFGMVDPNLDASINNISGSSNVAFAIFDTLSLNSLANYNNTPLVTYPPIDNACVGQPFSYNPGLNDPDNDILVYSLLPNFYTGTSGTSASFSAASGFSTPSGGLSVDPVTGTLNWATVPSTTGEYEIDMLIREFRLIEGIPIEIASEVFAVQIYVQCCNSVVSIPPALKSVKGCVEAGEHYSSPSITASESSPPAGSVLSMTASGVPLSPPNNATFSSASGSANASLVFNWTPSCNNIQLNPYYVTVQAFDNNTPVNVNYSNISVQVVSPPVTNLTDSVKGDTIKVNWSPPACVGTNTANVIVDYLIYRANNCAPYTVTPCKTGPPPLPSGVQSSAWYLPVGTTTSTVFYDTNSGQGFAAGNTYAYIVIAQYADGSLSMAPTYTSSICVTLHLGIPILTNVSVDTTDATAGSMLIRWHRPLVGGQDLDTLLPANQGPYYFVLQRSKVSPGTTPVSATSSSYTTIYTSPSRPHFNLINSKADTTYYDSTINTRDSQYYYKVLFYANGHYIGSGTPASSIFASGVGHDRKVALSWQAHTPWTNTMYYIYMQNGTNNGYTLVGSTTNTVDTVKGLTNKYTYCFRIMSSGTYFNPDIVSPDTNWSQKVCVAPIDDSPPCQPQLSIAGNCNESVNKLTWRNPDHACNIDDVLKYYIYYTPREDSTMTKIDSVLNVNDTTYTTNYNLATIAGCYIIVAVDSAGNRSAMNDTTCTDDCPEYELPNIFTPNGDNINDLYTPVKNKYVRSVNFVMYNRWGEVVYENTNPSLGWDGKSKQMKQSVPDGTYFYTCTVNEIHYYGIESIKLKGFVQLIK